MKFLDKLGLALFSIITLVIAIVLCLIGFGWMDPTIFSILIGKVLISQTYTYIMIAVCILLMLLAIRCIFFSEVDEKKEEDNSGILLQNEDGKLLITVETLKNMVNGVCMDFKEIVKSETEVSITKENEIIINVAIDVAHNTVIKNISSKLQTEIKRVIKIATGLDIESVNVRIRNVENEVEINKVISEKIAENEENTEKNNDKIIQKNIQDNNKKKIEKKNVDTKPNEKKNTSTAKKSQNKNTKKTK